MNNKIVRISAICVLISATVFAQRKGGIATAYQIDDVVIFDSKLAVSKEKSGKVIGKITTADSAKKAGHSIAAVLSSAAGVEINENHSGAGTNLSYYVRRGR